MRKPSNLRVTIRPPGPGDRRAFLAAVGRSRSLHHPWVSAPATPRTFAAYLKRLSTESHRGFLVIHRGTGDLVGVININHIIRGALQAAFLGYYGFEPHSRAGLMREGMLLVLDHAFRKLKLHRLEANIQPRNRASIALARKCGFTHEGFSRRYLKVCGRWRDHQRWALLAEHFQPG
jgi:ribosomal-protein-alanine N-acetyltransferase